MGVSVKSTGSNINKSEFIASRYSDLMFAVIVAAGSGIRAGGDVPKQFRILNGIPMIWHSILAFNRVYPDTELILVLSDVGIEMWNCGELNLTGMFSQINPHKIHIVRGGEERTDSVVNALESIRQILNDKHADADKALVAVHDAARPLVTDQVIQRGWLEASRCEACIPAVASTDSLRFQREMGGNSTAVDRSQYFAVQTPQVFNYSLLSKAYKERKPDTSYTDDASVVEELKPIMMFEGDFSNFKVTRPDDFITAEALLKHREEIDK